jgi:putative ABC transport system permease protein
LRARGIDLRTAMQSGGRTMTAGRRARATANGLVVFQVALAVVLLAGAGLLIRSFAHLTAMQPGFRAEGLVVGGVALPETRYSDTERRRLAYHEILAHVAVAPGVARAALTGLMPFTDTEDFEGVRIEGVTQPESAQPPMARYYVVTPGYFSTLEIPLLAGRALEDGDHAGTLPVAVINQAMADALFADQDPIGRRVTLADTSWRTIVGVVGSVRYSGLDAEPQPEAYVPLAQADWPYMLLVARTTAGPDVVVPGLRAAVARFDRDLPLSDVRSIEGLRANSLAQRRLNMLLLVAFAALALVLAAVGLYGVLGQDVARRQQEIGVRLALGASPAVALRLILRDAALMIGAGAGIGVVAALALSRLLASLLYGIPAYDALTFATVTLFITAVALVASYLPARRAMRTDPLTALRAE